MTAGSLHAQTTLSFNFDTFNTGTILNQQGWSAGNASAFLTGIENPSTHVLEDTHEQIVSTAAHSGNQSWQYINGVANVYSFGNGTPFSPNLGVTTAAVGSMFTASFWFKPSSPGDGSWMELDTGNPAGNDRAEFVAYLNNYTSATDFSPGLSVTTLDARGNEFDVIAGLDDTIWHLFSFTLTHTDTNENSLSISVDGGTPVVVPGNLAIYRADNSFAYEDSSRLKFVGSHNANGFYIDDVSYSIVPEPSTYAGLAGLLAFGTVLLRRKQKR